MGQLRSHVSRVPTRILCYQLCRQAGMLNDLLMPINHLLGPSIYVTRQPNCGSSTLLTMIMKDARLAQHLNTCHLCTMS